jgi:hypothetical protein
MTRRKQEEAQRRQCIMSGLPGHTKTKKKKRMGKEEGGERTKRTQALPDTNGPADESGAKTERKVSRNQGQEAGNNLGGGSSRVPTSSDTRCRMHFDHHSSGCCILARQSSLPNRPTPPYCTHTSTHPVRHAPGSKKKLHSHVFSFRKLSTQSFRKKKRKDQKKRRNQAGVDAFESTSICTFEPAAPPPAPPAAPAAY